MNKKTWAITGAPFFLLVAAGFRWLDGVEGLVPELLLQSVFATAIYLVLYRVVFSCSPWKVSLCWLGLPVLVFAIGWLRWYWAAAMTVVWFLALYRTCRADNGQYMRASTVTSFFWGSLLVLCWVYLCGAGGYGFQTQDYVMHNGRLEDLVRYAWPVNYTHGILLDNGDVSPENTMLVTYSGYYLVAALFGKIFGLRFAYEFMHYWTLFGCWLAYRWLLEFVSIRFPALVAAVFVMFGGWDIAGTFLLCIPQCSVEGFGMADVIPMLADAALAAIHNPNANLSWIDSELGAVLGTSYFFGNVASLTYSLFWAPHQSIAGWVGMALLLAAWQGKHFRSVCFIYALLALWTPMIILGLVLFPLLLILQGRLAGIRAALSFENVAGGGTLVLVAGLYYLSATALTNPMAIIFLDAGYKGLPWLLAFNFFGWGIYAVAIYPCIRKMEPVWQNVFYVLCATFFILSCLQYGTYNDMMVRSTAPLMFCLVIFVARSASMLWHSNKKPAAMALALLLTPGFISFFENIHNSFANNHVYVKGQSVVDYAGGWQFLGSRNSLYARYLSANPDQQE